MLLQDIQLIILIFTFSINPNIKQYYWYYVMYHQCGWLLFAKLYLNEIKINQLFAVVNKYII